MWINGLKILNKPLLHLHTQFNRDIPWQEIDMDFMNLNQAAHGDREHGYIMSRLRIERKVVAGYWKEPEVVERILIWARAALAWHDMQHLKIARFGDNMREVAVTEGDKVEAQIRFGFSVNSFGIGDLVKYIQDVSEKAVDQLTGEYAALYTIPEKDRPGGEHYQSIRYQARLELALKSFLVDGGFNAYTDTFEDLHGLAQLPGLATQRLMAAGFGFGAEGDWKQAALVRAFKIMGSGMKGGSSFMEDYTYHLDPAGNRVLGAHMLEICPSIASGKPSLEVHPLSIGNKEAPARLVFDAAAGPAVNACLVDMGNRFRLILNTVDCVPPEPLPHLPVARALWTPRPDLRTSATAWIYAGGAHHTAFSQALSPEYIEDFTTMMGIEYIQIDENTDLSALRKELRWNAVYYQSAGDI
jgi:L-arabinose isomerase